MYILFIIAGYISTILTTLSYTPQIITVIIHKSGKNISFPYLLLLFLDVILYLVYGIGFILDNNTDATPMIIGACLQIMLLSLLTMLKIYFTVQKKILQRTDNTSQIEDTPSEIPQSNTIIHEDI